jgi:AcrR family transcriptional regulator/predicted N-acetyltransferase YhbS
MVCFVTDLPTADVQEARPRQARAERTRSTILECAAAAFARDGYDGTSLNDVVRGSGLTKGAFYFHFASKEELALAVFRHKQEQFLERAAAETSDRPDALAELAALLRARVRLYAEDPSARCVLRIGAELGAKAGPGSEFAAFQDLTIETFAGIVRRGQLEGSVRAGLDPRATGEAIFAAVVGTDRISRILADSADIERRTEELIDLLVHAVAAPSPTASTKGASPVSSAVTAAARKTEITILPLERDDIPEADTVFRLAFGTMLGLPEPLRFAEGAQLIRSRWEADPAGAFKAVAGGELVGSAFATRWGSFALFGPLSVRPDYWDRGAGTRLWEARLPLLDLWGVTHAGLFTQPQSTKHVHLYRKFGFWPRFLTALTDKPVATDGAPGETYSSLGAAARERVLRDCAALTDEIYPGLDVTREIRVVAEQHIGDVVLVHEAGELAGFAVCHAGAGSETVPGTCYVKFAAVRPGAGAATRLGLLLDGCEGFAAAVGLARLEVGVNLARHDAYRLLAERGHRTFRQGVAMHRPNEDGFDRPDVFVLDDWR